MRTFVKCVISCLPLTLMLLMLLLYPYVIEDDIEISDDKNEVYEVQPEKPGFQEDQWDDSVEVYIVA